MANKAKRQIRFYSKEELKELQPYINGKKIDKQHIAEFCKNHKREYNSVLVNIYTRRKAAGVVTSPKKDKFKTEAVLKPRKAAINMAKGEFKIPVSSWNVTNDNGQFYFVVKF